MTRLVRASVTLGRPERGRSEILPVCWKRSRRLVIVFLVQLNVRATSDTLRPATKLCEYIAHGIQEAFVHNNLTILQKTAYYGDTEHTDETIDIMLMEMKKNSRIIYCCEIFRNVFRQIMIRAYLLGMCNGEFIFVYPNLFPPRDYDWKNNDEYDDIARIAYKYIIHLTVGYWKGEAGEKQINDFNVEVIRRMSEPPWNTTIAEDRNLPAGFKVANLYESMYLYGMWANHSITHNVGLRNGTAWLQFTKGKSFPGMGGPCEIGDNGDKISHFWIYQFSADDGKAQLVAESEDFNRKIVETLGFHWETTDGLPPRDSPACGFLRELCPQTPNPGEVSLVLVSSLLIFLLLFVSLIIVLAIRKKKVEMKLLQSIWQINAHDIEMIDRKERLGSTVRSLKAYTSSTISMRSVRSRTYTDRSASIFGESETKSAIDDVTLAAYKKQIVVVKELKHTALTLKDLHDLKTMREYRHDNVNTFIGACFETSSPIAAFLYCRKGSLQNVLENEEIQLDLNFKISLTIDLINGMHYIHNSVLGSHGRLKSSNCLVDGRWMLKVTDYGMGKFISRKNTDESENDIYKGLLWTAPELLVLSQPNRNPKGTKEGDVYSFGIIMHEIFYRMGPFAGHGLLTPKELVSRIKAGESPPRRPTILSDQEGITPDVTRLMQMCWEDETSKRPTFSTIHDYMVKKIQLGMSGNIVDLILQRLEKYSTNLEDLVKQRTKELFHEKQKSDKLLYRMLPKSCAETLKAGKQVTPEIFQEATVFFSDIVGFTTISSLSTPMQVVDLLNDLYICFDSIINKYDAYKVETIGDAYLVVSGVPRMNGKLHAGVIADMSLDIVEKVDSFKIKHLPGRQLRVRIGNHTGSCCAGVVGSSMPRYCLFGDTVDIACKLESSGEAGKVHLSETSHLALQVLGNYSTAYRGEIQVKEGLSLKTYWLLPKSTN